MPESIHPLFNLKALILLQITLFFSLFHPPGEHPAAMQHNSGGILSYKNYIFFFVTFLVQFVIKYNLWFNEVVR